MQNLLDFGYSVEQAEAAAKRNGSVERCIEWICLQADGGGGGGAGGAGQEEEEDEHVCEVCTCAEPQSSMVLGECAPEKHWVCRTCLAPYCEMKIDAHEVLAIGCPCLEDGCQKSFSSFVICATVDEEHRARYERLLVEKGWAADNERVVHCPACDFMAEWTLEAQRHAVRCQNDACETAEFCGLCGFAPHFKEGDPEMSMDCAAYARWKAENDGADEAFAAYMAENEVQKCPKCSEACEKAAGCNFMYCKCKTRFCLQCGRELTENQHYSHFGEHGPFGHGCLGGKKDDKGHVSAPLCDDCPGYEKQKTACAQCSGWNQ